MPSMTIVLGLMLAWTPVQVDKYTEIKGLAPVPSYTVRTIKDRIVVDGDLSEKAWKQAAFVTLIFPWDSQRGKKQRTTVKLLRNQDNLYVAFDCEDTDITASYENRDDPVARDDCVEIFIKPDEASDSYFGLEMNARGVLLDYFYPYPNRIDKAVNLTGVQIKTRMHGTLNRRDDTDKRWSLEMAIPLLNFSGTAKGVVLKPHEKWRMQFNRWDGTEDVGRRLSMWCHSGLKLPRPHNPERFGTVIFE